MSEGKRNLYLDVKNSHLYLNHAGFVQRIICDWNEIETDSNQSYKLKFYYIVWWLIFPFQLLK